ncbi:DUF4123 domain-containing protein [Denitromonas iodatirespirans]|uniref:DUF4123 domain-containing protein n=1 Tax=Denitromonas iodatirespirans TaxID=2795389 RepID=A0A944H981_DENI1|nr:DUF4123 domain-containing protein [Denitromonas iodatirespirans]MBT0963128.1 DUF4123 domain-containing protein [Denitromonas iodatirespirans]
MSARGDEGRLTVCHDAVRKDDAMTRFLQNTHGGSLAPHLSQWLAQCGDETHSPYALIDMSMLEPTTHGRLERLAGPSIELLAGTDYEAYGELGPRLFALSAIDSTALARLTGTTDARPALSVLEITTHAGVPDLRGLQWLADAQGTDDTRLYCRYADTRILPNVLSVLDPTQSAWLARTIRRWAWVGRDGTLESIDFTPTDSAAPRHDETRIHFDDAQFGTLMQAAEADTLFDDLHDQSPEIIPTADPATLWRRLDALLDIARTHGIDDAPDQRQFITLAWSASEHFHTLPALAATFDATRSGSKRFADAVAGWNDDIWNQIEALAEHSAKASASEHP